MKDFCTHMNVSIVDAGMRFEFVVINPSDELINFIKPGVLDTSVLSRPALHWRKPEDRA